MKFISSSPPTTDFQNKLILNKLEIMAGNILYLTHELDKTNKTVTEIKNSVNLQKQVDQYFEEDTKQDDSSDRN